MFGGRGVGRGFGRISSGGGGGVGLLERVEGMKLVRAISIHVNEVILSVVLGWTYQGWTEIFQSDTSTFF